MSKFGRCLSCRAKVSYVNYISNRKINGTYDIADGYDNKDLIEIVEHKYFCPICDVEIECDDFKIDEFFTLEE